MNEILVGYVEFLKSTGLTSASIPPYVSMIKQVLRQKWPRTTEELLLYYNQLKLNNQGRFITAWRHFVKFAATHGEIFPDFPKKEAAKEIKHEPPFIPLSLICWVCSYKLTQTINWTMADYHWDPERKNRVVWGQSSFFEGANRVKAVKLIINWAYPNGYKEEWPLLPLEPCTSLEDTPKPLPVGVARLWTTKLDDIQLDNSELEEESAKLYLQSFGSSSLIISAPVNRTLPESVTTTSELGPR